MDHSSAGQNVDDGVQQVRGGETELDAFTSINRTLLDPSRWGWTAGGGVADLLTPHEVRTVGTVCCGGVLSWLLLSKIVAQVTLTQTISHLVTFTTSLSLSLSCKYRLPGEIQREHHI